MVDCLKAMSEYFRVLTNGVSWMRNDISVPVHRCEDASLSGKRDWSLALNGDLV